MSSSFGIQHSTQLKGFIVFTFIISLLFGSSIQALDYKDALVKSILFYEGQRSGKLSPATKQNKWRSNAAVNDGFAEGVDLVGGYHDAGDNVKYGFPMAFTVTLLSWSTIEYRLQLKVFGQLKNTMDALKWGTDYFVKAHTEPFVLWGQVGTGATDHACWERPEDMDTPRTAFAINATHPGSDLAGETAASLAAAYLVFKYTDKAYADKLLVHAKQLFTFADAYRGAYSDIIPDANVFYKSYSGYGDELVWSAGWLYRATKDPKYLQFLIDNEAELNTRYNYMKFFSWDNKLAGSLILFSQIYMSKSYNRSDADIDGILKSFKTRADYFVCDHLPGSPTRSIKLTPEGYLYLMPGSSQYALNAAFLLSVYSDLMTKYSQTLTCGGTVKFSARQVFEFSKGQVDYLLGKNKARQSYMAGFGKNYPQQVHHRGASIVSVNVDNKTVGCGEGYHVWFHKDEPNPNVHVGAIVAGPDGNDFFNDTRLLSSFTEVATYFNSPAVGLLAKLSGLYYPKLPPPTALLTDVHRSPPPGRSSLPSSKKKAPPPPRKLKSPPVKRSPPPPKKKTPPASKKKSPPPPKKVKSPPVKKSPLSPKKKAPPPPKKVKSPPVKKSPPSTKKKPPPPPKKVKSPPSLKKKPPPPPKKVKFPPVKKSPPSPKKKPPPPPKKVKSPPVKKSPPSLKKKSPPTRKSLQKVS